MQRSNPFLRVLFALNALVLVGLIAWQVRGYFLSESGGTLVIVPAELPQLDTKAIEGEALDTSEEGSEAALLSSMQGRESHPLHQQASAAFSNGNVDTAIALARQALVERPKDAAIWNDLGVYLLSKEDYSGAIKSITTATQIEPEFARAQYNLGTAYLKAGTPGEAIAPLRRAVELEPYTTAYHYNLAQVLADAGQADSAILEYLEVAKLAAGAGAAKAYYNIGLVELGRNRVRDALEAFTQALSLRAGYVKARYNKAVLLSRTGHDDQAEVEYRKLLDLQADHAATLNNLGAIYIRQERWRDAAEMLRRALAADPTNAIARYNLGLCHARLGEDDQAVAELEKAVSVMPEYPEAWYNLALALKRLGRINDAVGAYQKAVEYRPDKAEYHYNLALAWQETGNREQAVASYQRATEIDPGYYKAHYNLGVVLLRLDRYEEAAGAFALAAALRPGSYEARYNEALALLKLGRNDQAAVQFEAAIEVQPTVEAYYNLGIAFERGEDEEAALGAFQKGLQLDPKHLPSIGKVADEYVRLRRFEDAAKRLGMMQQLAPDDPTAFNLGLQARQQKDYDGAAALFRVGTRAPPPLASKSYNALGLTYKDLGRPLSEVLEAYQQAVELDPGNTKARQNFAVALEESGDLERARTQISIVIDAEPSDHVPLRIRGRIWNKLGDFGKARSDFEASLKIKPDSIPTLSELADLLAANERKDEALQVLRRAEQFAPGRASVRQRIQELQAQ